MSDFKSAAERHAEEATRMHAFPINLLEVRRTVEQILSLFGRSNLFPEYTTHDITHVDDMLSAIDWLIPINTQKNMSKADWLMLVLSVYFHDMGLIVTEDEFKNRGKSGFVAFVDQQLYGTPGGAEYKAKLASLEEDARDRLLYQEFVRWNHGARIRAWIDGNHSAHLGHAQAQVAEIARLLQPLDIDFRRDLGMICESHNLDDIDDTKKYRLSHPYGNSDDETANLQYAALILRTVDLLQITNRRAPSALFRLINPTDPLSQVEWLKQNAVKRVRPRVGVNADGVADATAPTDTIEVFARFDNEGAFFGLTSYLKYAGDQLEMSFGIAKKSEGKTVGVYSLPWRRISDNNIQVDGFIKHPFGFEIDQDKILELLTGHTLYNDSDVVVRELTQNAIDAVRLQYDKSADSSSRGMVRVTWDSAKRELSVLDNGTGMTQEIIENHLLKVGSSRYQDPKFVETHPGFSPISRFGIGVLSAFMVADSVEIVTVSPEESEARQISLRSVHGKYLIRLLEKSMDERARKIGAHGTLFKLTFRTTAKDINVLETIRRWVMFPRCKVSVEIDGQDAIGIGFATPRAALEEYLSSTMAQVKTRVEEKSEGGLTVAYAMRYNAHFREWDFVTVPDARTRELPEARISPVGTCVEGIAVEFTTPGFLDRGLLAIANATGAGAPRTNVARSAIEATSERERAAEVIYRLLCDGVVREGERLVSQEGYSLTWAVDQLPYVASPIMGGDRVRPQYPVAHRNALRNLKILLVEDADGRSTKSLNELNDLGQFSTVDSQLFSSVEQFIRESKAEITARTLLQVSQGGSVPMPIGPMLANRIIPHLLVSVMEEMFEVGKVRGVVAERRVDLTWQRSAGLWRSSGRMRSELLSRADPEIYSLFRQLGEVTRRGRAFAVLAPSGDLEVEGLDGYCCVIADGKILILPDTSLGQMFVKLSKDQSELVKYVCYLEAISFMSERSSFTASGVDRFFRQVEINVNSRHLPSRDELVEAVEGLGARNKLFDPFSWVQRESLEAM